MLGKYESNNGTKNDEEEKHQQQADGVKVNYNVHQKPLNLMLNSLSMEMMTASTPSPFSAQYRKMENTKHGCEIPENFQRLGINSSSYPLSMHNPSISTENAYRPLASLSLPNYSPYLTTPVGQTTQMFFPTTSKFHPNAVKTKLQSEKSKNLPSKKKRTKRKKCSGVYCTCGLSEEDAYLANYMFKKNNVKFMEELQHFHYEICEKSTEVTKKKVFEFKCKFNGNCNMRFERAWNLLDHCRMHYGIKPFQCEECGRSFTQRGNLGKHKLTHNKEK
ncbi:unnamed protein product [Moneuplotes crassus]|uniref:C2H2-type domain-containing protein n=1 Tax=Euplotes crassus TaxID=5936 RepID=A0AAD1U1A3_EUPCR|nr:unnamed protein product [Moneuplotes crassus]